MSRTRRREADGSWTVVGRVERFIEPALLLLLAHNEAHGYQLAEELAALAPTDRVDFGNLYRLLRTLEDEGLVESSWRAELPGPAKRSYAITDDGRALLEAWVEALRKTENTINEFFRRHQEV